MQEGQMDLIVVERGSQRTYIDVTIASPAQANAQFLLDASTKPGFAASRAEHLERQRYPNVNILPFALEIVLA